MGKKTRGGSKQGGRTNPQGSSSGTSTTTGKGKGK